MMLPPGKKSPAVKMDESKIPEEIFTNSKLFYAGSPNFVRKRQEIKFAAGFTCSQCGLKSRQPHSQHCYCYLHKRIVDAQETCPENTRNNYKSVNF